MPKSFEKQKRRQWIIDSVHRRPMLTLNDPGLVSTIQVFSVYQQEDPDGVCLSTDVFKCWKHEKKSH